MDIPFLTRIRYFKTVTWTLLLCCGVVAVAAILARATLNLTAALTDQPDLAIYLLDKKISSATLLKDSVTRRDYLAQSNAGQELVELTKINDQWQITWREDLHE